MKQIIARVLSFLPGLLFLSNAYTWITNPLAASNGLGMEYLEGIGTVSYTHLTLPTSDLV